MNKDSKIFVAGHRGLVGSAILKNLKAKGYTNFVLRTHAELDLTDQQAAREVREHNNFARRMPVVEEQIKVINHRLQDLEQDMKGVNENER